MYIAVSNFQLLVYWQIVWLALKAIITSLLFLKHGFLKIKKQQWLAAVQNI